MVESGMGAEVVGDKGRNKGKGREKGGEAMWAVMMVKELWRKGVWTDAKTVSIVSLAAFHPNTKVQSAALHFFLGSENEDEDDSDDEDEVGEARRDVRKMEHRMEVSRGKRKKEKQVKQLKKEASKKRKKRAEGAGATPNFPALELLHDPQTFGEKLYDNLHKHDKIYSLEHKILIMQLLSRVMGVHKLCVLGFYSYIIKYLTYHQLQVTLILVSLAQSVHDLTPPDVLTPVIRKLAQEFVHPGVGAEVIAAGLNAIREVCRRQPWCMEEDLLSDLIEYRKSKDKGVVTASRGLLQLFREVNPGMLKRRERGKAASMGLIGSQVLAYGHSADAAEGIEGLELLEEHYAQLRKEANGGMGGRALVVEEKIWKSVIVKMSQTRRGIKRTRGRRRGWRGVRGRPRMRMKEVMRMKRWTMLSLWRLPKPPRRRKLPRSCPYLLNKRSLHPQTLPFSTNSVSRQPRNSLLPAVAPLPSASLLLWKPPSDMLAKTKRTDSLPKLRFLDRGRRPRRLGRRGWRVSKKDERAGRSLVV
ncbi:protein SDA1 [Cryptococcus deuterogattii 99/473]|uniref:Protein SDA1 n=1 Tax=Cryptococcus deuterogattii Ram5 TaxID=1296110 RepID=A0A0D0T6T4_9TREE|nr:protein SDA1 [Cryptococcus deuterogattii Ram5]KIY56653.1 protein SDA1 [Cryptococcus deuterogattii 99/473]